MEIMQNIEPNAQLLITNLVSSGQKLAGMIEIIADFKGTSEEFAGLIRMAQKEQNDFLHNSAGVEELFNSKEVII